jgi:hypothetical protein
MKKMNRFEGLRKQQLRGFLILIILLLSTHPVFGQEVLSIGDFSSAEAAVGLPEEWEPLIFDDIDRHTVYKLVEKDGSTVVKAESENSASGLIKKIDTDPGLYPVLQWRWRVDSVYEKADVTTKAGDDYPARIYVAFAFDPEKAGFLEKAKFKTYKLIYGEYPPARAINYIWASRAGEGTMVANAYTDRVKMIVVESGTENLGKWVSEERNIRRDFLEAFGEEPPKLSGIAIMTDSDNTNEAATAYYGDIRLRMKSP